LIARNVVHGHAASSDLRVGPGLPPILPFAKGSPVQDQQDSSRTGGSIIPLSLAFGD
jgi:hypothetical protein